MICNLLLVLRSREVLETYLLQALSLSIVGTEELLVMGEGIPKEGLKFAHEAAAAGLLSSRRHFSPTCKDKTWTVRSSAYKS